MKQWASGLMMGSCIVFGGADNSTVRYYITANGDVIKPVNPFNWQIWSDCNLQMMMKYISIWWYYYSYELSSGDVPRKDQKIHAVFRKLWIHAWEKWWQHQRACKWSEVEENRSNKWFNLWFFSLHLHLCFYSCRHGRQRVVLYFRWSSVHWADTVKCHLEKNPTTGWDWMIL